MINRWTIDATLIDGKCVFSQSYIIEGDREAATSFASDRLFGIEGQVSVFPCLGQPRVKGDAFVIYSKCRRAA